MEEIETYKLIWLNTRLERIYRIVPEGGDLIARWLTLLNESGAQYAVAGAFAVNAHTGIWRNTKDFDVFLAPRDLQKALAKLEQAYFNPDIRDTCWLAKVESTPFNLDIIFGFRNGQLKIDSNWLGHCHEVEIMGIETRVLAVEELIASKAFIAKRDRFDGADIVHLLREVEGKLDWDRLLGWMGENQGLLLWYLMLFLFVYPGHSNYIPRDLLMRLFEQATDHNSSTRNPKAFRGILLDPISFEVDLIEFGYEGYFKAKPLVNDKGEPL
jgi:predicted nucleotidyltransferase